MQKSFSGLIAAGLLVAGTAMAAQPAVVPTNSPAKDLAKDAAKPLTVLTNSAEAGIHVEHIRLSAQGRMVDMRYRVTDPAKAGAFSKRELKPYLIDQITGTRLPVPNSPKVGPLRQLAKDADPKKIYFSIFSNPGMLVKSGSKVSLVLGEVRIDNLMVE